MRVKASIARDDASAKRKLPDTVMTPTPTTAAASTRVIPARVGAGTKESAMTMPSAAAPKDELVSSSRYNYSSSSGRSKLQLECSDGRVFDVTHEEAMMSSTLWMLLQDVADSKVKTMVKQHMIPIYDVPSNSVELALFYCRCLYKQQVEGQETALHAWDERFLQLDSKTLCDLAKVASHLDIQPLVDLTCRSIAQIMSATEAAHEIRQKFGLDDSPGAIECSCELRSGMSGFDFDVFNSLDHDLSTDEYELVEFDQPSVDELVSFINGSGAARPVTSSLLPGGARGKKDCHVHPAAASGATASAAAAMALESGDSASKKKSKKNKKKKKKAAAQTVATGSSSSNGGGADAALDQHAGGKSASVGPATTASTSTQESAAASKSSNNVRAKQQPNSSDSRNRRVKAQPSSSSSTQRAAGTNHDVSTKTTDDDDLSDDNSLSDDTDSSDEASARSAALPRDLQEKMRLARQNPSAIFCESQFEEEDDEEMAAQIESFRRALESAHLDSSARAKPKPRVKFAPQDVFRSTLVASQRVSAAI